MKYLLRRLLRKRKISSNPKYLIEIDYKKRVKVTVGNKDGQGAIIVKGSEFLGLWGMKELRKKMYPIEIYKE